VALSEEELCGLWTHPLADADPQTFLNPRTDGGSFSSLYTKSCGRGLTADPRLHVTADADAEEDLWSKSAD
jgi:hypothetical protein